MTPGEELRKELNDIAPDFPVQEYHTAPDGYFKDLPDEILNRWRIEKSKSSPKEFKWKNVTTIAAILGTLLIGALWLITSQKQQSTMAITSEEAYQYVQENIEDFENLIETYDYNSSVTHPDISEDELQDYLIEELEEENHPEDLF